MDYYRTKIFSLNRMDELIKNAGVDKVSRDAILELEGELVNYGEMVAKEAVSLAIGDKRQTVEIRDIEEAVLNVNLRLRIT
jgi:histone H3/H4